MRVTWFTNSLLFLYTVTTLVLIILLFGVTATITALMNASAPVLWCQSVADFTLKVVGSAASPSQGGKYLASLQAIRDLLVVGLTAAFAAAPTLAIAPVLFDWRRRQSVKVSTIHAKGREDLAIMERYFRGAEHVTLYAGDFSWFTDPTPPSWLDRLIAPIQKIVLSGTRSKPPQNATAQALLRELERLLSANKLRMVSSKTQEEVRTGMKEHFDRYQPVLIFGDSRNLKCSIVRYGQGSYAFLDKSSGARPEGLEMTVAVFTEARETRNVLNTLAKLLEIN